jgi:hypothetical protein
VRLERQNSPRRIVTQLQDSKVKSYPVQFQTQVRGEGMESERSSQINQSFALGEQGVGAGNQYSRVQLEVSPIKSVLQIFEFIRRNKRQAQKQLKEFVVRSEKQDQRFTLQEFYNFLKQLPIQDTKKEKYFESVIQVLDFQRTGEIFVPDFSRSFSSYLYYEEIVRDQQQETVRSLQSQLERKKYSANDFDRLFIRHTEFGFIQKHRFIQVMQSVIEDDVLIDKLVYLLDPSDEGLIQAGQLTEYLRNYKIYQ